MQTIGEYVLAAVLCAVSGAIAIGLAATFGGSVLEYLVGMVLFRVGLWEAAGLIAAVRKERDA